MRIGGAGLCRTDLHIIEGQWAEKMPVQLPNTLGLEYAVCVQEVGSAVSNVAVGDTVIVHPLITCGFCRACRAGDDVHCINSAFPGIGIDGGMANFLKTSARSVVKLDPSVHPKDIAALAAGKIVPDLFFRADHKAGRFFLRPWAQPLKISSGTLLYRNREQGLEVLLVHPSGNFNRRAPWSIPKGEANEKESLEQAARRETLEETGVTPGPLISLGHSDYQKSRKRVHCFAGPAPADAVPRNASWEIDQARFVPIEEARALLHPDQQVFIDRLIEFLQAKKRD